MSYNYYIGPWVWDTSEPDLPHWRAPSGTVGLVDLRPLDIPDTYGFFAAEQDLPSEDYTLLGTALDEQISTVTRDAWRGALNISESMSGSLTVLDLLWDTLFGGYGDPDGAERCPPGLPTHKGIYELHLAGHSLVRSRKYRGGEHDPNWRPMQALLQRNYRKIRQQTHDRRSRDPEKHRKVLGAWERKYKVHGDLLIPADLPKEKALRPETTITDDFNRASLGSDWVEHLSRGDWSINSNIYLRAETTNEWGPPELYNTNALSSDDHYCQIYVVDAGTLWGLISVCCRDQGDGTQTAYYGFVATDGTRRIRKIVNGAKTGLINDSAGSVSFPYTQQLEATGSSIKLFANGVEQQSVTDSSIAGHVNVSVGGDPNTWAHGDDFIAEDLLATVTIIPPPLFNMGMVA